MRYELYLLPVSPGAAPDAAAAFAARLEGDADPGPLVPETERWKRALAAALVELDPRLETLEADLAAVAALAGIGEEEARRRNRDLELAGPEEGSGVEITLADDGAVVSLPYRHGGEGAVRAWRETWSMLEVLCRIGPFTPWDPQLGRVLELGTDIAAVLDCYAAGGGAGKPGEQAEEEKRAWWKFW